MEKQTLEKLEAALEAVENDLSGRVTELASRAPRARSRRTNRLSMNTSCVSMICERAQAPDRGVLGAADRLLTMGEPMRTRVQQRAQHACEYCRLPQRASLLPHQIDHIIAQQHMGSDEESNLCLCCLRATSKRAQHRVDRPRSRACLPHRGVVSSSQATLGHPLSATRRWAHRGRDSGRSRYSTALDFNAEERVQLRRLLMQQGWRP